MSAPEISPWPVGWAEGYDLLSALHEAAFSPQGDRPWSASEFRDMVESPGVKVLAEHAGGSLSGYILVRAVCDEAELISIAVSPYYRKHGSGGRLLDAAICMLRSEGVENFFLEVREDNEAAIRLYRSRGFEVSGKRPDYYQTQGGNRIDALCFTLILNQ